MGQLEARAWKASRYMAEYLWVSGEEHVDRGETPGSVICEGGEFRMEDKDLVEELGEDLKVPSRYQLELSARMLRLALVARMITLL